MCIAILNPPKLIISRKALWNCWSNNSDGAGLLWVENKTLKAYKEVTDFDKFYKVYKAVRNKLQDTHIVLHFRISTSGKVDETNTHPFFTNKHLAFCHNGIIKEMELDPAYSDTYMFNEKILKKLPRNFCKNSAIMTMMGEYIGASKLLFLNDNNEYFIVNEAMGHWHDGCWWSNHTYTYAYSSGSYGGCGTASCSSDWYKEENKYQSSLYDKDDISDYCSECGAVLVSEYEHRYKICIKCMDDLREELDSKYLVQVQTETADLRIPDKLIKDLNDEEGKLIT